MESAGDSRTEGAEGAGVVATARPRANVFGHDALAGTFRTRLEATGRLVLPSALRAPFVTAGTGHVMPRRAECLWLLTPQGFEVMVDDLVANQSDGMLAAETRTLFFKAAP